MDAPKMTQKQLVEEYRINKYQLSDYMRNSMHIPSSVLPALEVYNMIHIPGKCLNGLIMDGMINHQTARSTKKAYAIIYHGCFPAVAKHAHEIRLSFRAAKPEFGIEPIVLVQIVSDVKPENTK